MKSEPIEFWLPVKGMEDKYQVSDKGRVKSLSYNRTGAPQVLVNKSPPSRRYPLVHIGGCDKPVHMLVAEAFLGPRPEGMLINHKSGDRKDAGVMNLEYCTSSENAKHAFRVGLSCQKGERNGASKITESMVRVIRAAYDSGETEKSVGERFKISAALAGLIGRRKRWNHVT